MQREIKFRAWDKDSKKMLIPLSPVWFEENSWSDEDFAVCADNCNHVLMQFTGLHDKNGKEIYEGDVMRVKALGNPENINPVVWDSENSQCSMINWPMTPYSASFSEVIGNIYENPDLLKA